MYLFMRYLVLVHECQWLGCGNKTDSHLVTLHPASLLNSLIIAGSAFVGPIGYINELVTCEETIFSFSKLDLVYPFSSCLIALARTSRVMLNRNGEIGHPGLLPEGRIFFPPSITYGFL
jgi:hypothetical protein